MRQLFQRVPARLAAARGARAEITQIGQVARRLALARPEVRVSLYVDARQVFQTTGSGDLARTLAEVYGPSLGGSLLALGPVEAGAAHLTGFISGPELTRPGRGQINLLVNGRWVQPRSLLASIESAYRPLLPRGRHPVLALRIDTPGEQVDINIHPTKLEVRLLQERAIAAAIGDLIREALGRQPMPLQQPLVTGLDALWQPPGSSIAEDPIAWDDQSPIVTPGLPPLRLIGQVQGRLLLLEGPAGLYLVDQHRAHERILYGRLRAAHPSRGGETVALAEPLVIELSAAQVARFSRRLDELAALGFAWESFGQRAFLLRSAPNLPGVLPGASGESLAGLGEPDELLPALLALPDDVVGDGEAWQERLLVQLSCRTAIRRGRALERPAMRALVEQLGHTDAPAVCPHGSPLLVHVSGTLLERQFGWR